MQRSNDERLNEVDDKPSSTDLRRIGGMTDHFPLASAVESTRILSLGAVDMHELWR